MSRKLEDLDPVLEKKSREIIRIAAAMGINILITRTASYLHEQMAIFVQGRMPVADVNRFRAEIGQAAIVEAQNKIVTWTLKSKHVVKPGEKSKAFDFCILKDPKTPTWELKVDVNKDDIPDYEQVGRMAESLGLTWGGSDSWKKQGKFDPCHVQL